jgi:hypothetical protein
MKQLTEESMIVLEAGIPKLAQGAFQRAQYAALTSSGKVMRAVNGKLVETFADGTETVVRDLPSPVHATAGAKFKLKRRVSGAE